MELSEVQKLIIGVWELHRCNSSIRTEYTFENNTFRSSEMGYGGSINKDGSYSIREAAGQLHLKLGEEIEIRLFEITGKCMVWREDDVFYVLVRSL